MYFGKFNNVAEMAIFVGTSNCRFRLVLIDSFVLDHTCMLCSNNISIIMTVELCQFFFKRMQIDPLSYRIIIYAVVKTIFIVVSGLISLFVVTDFQYSFWHHFLQKKELH